MYVLKSTKKLTQFKEFAITPSQKDVANGVAPSNAFISPLKLKQLERKHGVSLLGGNTPSSSTVTTNNNISTAQWAAANGTTGAAANAPHFSKAVQLAATNATTPLESAAANGGAITTDTAAGQVSTGLMGEVEG